MPYSDSATTVASAGRGGVQQRAEHRVQLGRGRGGLRRRRAEALQVVVEVRDVDQGQVGVRGRPGSARPPGRSTGDDGSPAVGPQ